MISFSTPHEFEYKFAYPAAIVGEVLAEPSRLSLKLLGHVISPLKPESKMWGVATKTLAVALFILSTPYNLTVGLVGLFLKTLAAPFRKNVVLVSPKINSAVNTPPDTLKICTFNTALLPDVINALKRDVPESHIKPVEGTTEERVAKIAHEILDRNDDIVCMQEVLEPKAARLLAQKLSPVYPHAAFNVGATGLLLNSGLMIVSKYPLEKPKFIPFSDACGADSWAKKGVLGVTVVLPGDWKVNILNTHLNSDSGLWGWNDGVLPLRLKQLDQVHHLASTFTEPSEQTIICGDLNMPFVTMDIDDKYHVARDDSNLGIDYILVAKKGLNYNRISTRVIDQMNGTSDHPAVRVEVSF